MRVVAGVRVVEVTAETDAASPPEIPMHLLPQLGSVALQLRTTVKRVAVGAGLARNAELLQALRQSSGLPVVTSPAGGTVVLTGPGVLGFAGIGVPPQGVAFGIDWMMSRCEAWFRAAFTSAGIEGEVSLGKVEGAWCPGFSDIAVSGKKLVGVGFRVTRDWVVIRGVLPVQAYSEEEVRVLEKCQELLGLTLHRDAFTSVQEQRRGAITVTEIIELWRGVRAG